MFLIPLPAMCINCRLIPNSLNANINSSSCTCNSNFKYSSVAGTCFCKNKVFFYDPLSMSCLPCALAGNNMIPCYNCSTPYKISIIGCVYTPNLQNGANTAAGCIAGYVFNFFKAACICDIGSGYAVNSNGLCTLCSSTDTACKNCKNPYVYDGYICRHGSLVPNTALGSCAAGTTSKSHFLTK